jgi:hypothetical protein
MRQIARYPDAEKGPSRQSTAGAGEQLYLVRAGELQEARRYDQERHGEPKEAN